MVKKASHSRFELADTPIQQLVELSRHFGAVTEFVIAGGGNTSVKTADRLFVKGSGTALATIDADGFVEMEREPLARLLEQDLGADTSEREKLFKEAILAARVHPERGQRPSVECVLHNMLPRQFVVHTHATAINSITCCLEGERIAREILGDGILWIPYVNPGFTLAKYLAGSLADYVRRTGRDCPPAVLMQNHGLIACGESPEEILDHTGWLVERIEAHLASIPDSDAFGPVKRIAPNRARGLINSLGPILRALLAEGDSLKVLTFDDSEIVMSLAGGEHGKSAALAGPLTPDQIVYCNSFPMWFDPVENESTSDLIARLRTAVARHREKAGSPPLVVLVGGLGLFGVGDDFAQADTARLEYVDAIKVMSGAQRSGGIRNLPQRERQFIEEWEVEAYRRKVAAAGRQAGKASGLVALVTGAAQGFGLEISRELATEGAHVILCDINVDAAQDQASELSARCGSGRANSLTIDVTQAGSVSDTVHQAVRTYGGFDLVVSNAGVLRAGSVKSQLESDFDIVTAVNYKGYFLVVQNSAPILALQHQAKPDYWSDIIQINSKSGLAGSNRNGAYAGSKFGGVGLTQSFALELISDGIKVNAVCPGNYFDGPLWSDPETGLFVQYLRTGKVPGAKSIVDVRRYYEAKVPMGRGCTTADVMKAVYYLISQKYETGQAVPVTGGQVMLS
jgi:rhamnose utilization protein RhaD (predicted bifunctional aldolase and dehydrogenase)/NAD(P)-dependent dehydrogenase (short-subunit alcohol dehydrogenase family)